MKIVSAKRELAKWPEPEAENIEQAKSERRDLVLVRPAVSTQTPHFARHRPQAAFLAHLIAVAQHAPQTQEKRRAEPGDAITRYAAASKSRPATPGHSLKRAV